MRALSLWQPWASLVAGGAKVVETRTWPAPEGAVGEPVAVHAAKRCLAEGEWTDRVRDAVADVLGRPDLGGDVEAMRSRLPYGAVVATALLASCRRVVGHGVVDAGGFALPVAVLDAGGGARQRVLRDGLGDFAVGLWCWRLAGVEAVDLPVGARGAQGLWEWGGG